MIFKKLRNRMIAHIVWIVTVVAFITLFFVYRLHQESIEEHLRSDLLIYTKVVENVLLNTMKHHEGLNILREMLPIFAELHHIQKIRIINIDGRIELSSSSNDAKTVIKDSRFLDFLNAPSDTLNSQISKGNKTAFEKWRKLRNNKSCQKCHDKSKSIIGILWVETADKLSENILNTNFSIIGAVALVIIFFLSIATIFLFIRSVDRPIKELSATMDAIENGDFSARTKISGNNEFNQLAVGMNAMAEKLQKAKEHLIELHRHELHQAEMRAKIGDQAASLAHEIKNPISGIVFAVNSILRELNSSDKKREIFEEIVKQANRVEHNLEALLDFSRQTQLECELTDINTLIERILLFLSQQPDMKIIETQFDLERDIPKAMVDPKQIEQVLFNLIINATQAMSRGGILTIRTRQVKDNNKIRISIKDTGKGIAKEYHNKIFQPFFTTKDKGTGLGLTVCEEIVLRHNGKITFESEPGVGTIFIIELPLGIVRQLQPLFVEQNSALV